jgi:hypothetical protein
LLVVWLFGGGYVMEISEVQMLPTSEDMIIFQDM